MIYRKNNYDKGYVNKKCNKYLIINITNHYLLD